MISFRVFSKLHYSLLGESLKFPLKFDFGSQKRTWSSSLFSSYTSYMITILLYILMSNQ